MVRSTDELFLFVMVFWQTALKKLFCILMEVNKTMYGSNDDVQKKFGQFVSRITHTWCHICGCVECPHGRWKQDCQLTINELNFNFFANVPLFALNNTWIHAILSKMHAEWFFYPLNCQSHILERRTWLDRTMPYLWNSNYLGLWIKSCNWTLAWIFRVQC